MSRYDDFFKNKQAEPVDAEKLDYIPLEGCALTCQYCGDEVEVGKWYMAISVVVYHCTNGHKNILENFG